MKRDLEIPTSDGAEARAAMVSPAHQELWSDAIRVVFLIGFCSGAAVGAFAALMFR